MPFDDDQCPASALASLMEAQQAQTENGGDQESGEGASVNLDALAERVLILLKRELRIERERMGRWRLP